MVGCRRWAKLRKGSYLPNFVEPRRRWEKAFVNVVCEAYVKGVSTRKVEELVESMGARGMSKSQVSRMAAVLDEQVEAFRNQPLGEAAMPYVYADALYIKVRERSRVVSKAVLIAVGVNEHGERQVLDVDVRSGEMTAQWQAFFERLVARGLRGVQLVISDAHSGLKRAIQTVFTGASWQRCTVHFRRNVLAKVPKRLADAVMAVVKPIFQQVSRDDATEAVTRAVHVLDRIAPDAAEMLRDAEEDVLAYMAFPRQHWRQLHSTNPLERLNKEVRRRSNVVGIFPTDSSVLRLVGMLLIEQNDEWSVGRRYFSKASMAELLPREAAPCLVDNAVADGLPL